MYLSDREIVPRLGEIGFECDIDAHPFRPVEQVQASSVDLRLGTRFWRPKRFRSGLTWPFRRQIVDLRHRSLHESYPRHDWEAFNAGPDEVLTLRPGEMLLARTYEAFSMPPDLAGRMAARSSYARLGLAIHCGADHINPGWKGRMPLQLVNLSKRTIRFTPLTPIAQVIFIQLTSKAEHPYGAQNKYRDDDGGPSYWWRDKMVEDLASTHGEISLPPAIQKKLQALFATSSLTPDQLVRMYRFFNSRKSNDLANWNDSIDDFARVEGRRSMLSTIFRRGVPTAAALAIGALLSFLVIPWSGWHAAAAVASVILISLTVLIVTSRKPEFLDSNELLRLRRQYPGDF